MAAIDRIVEGLTAFLVHTLLRPKVWYIDAEKQKNVLTEPSILLCNHTGHLDGPAVNTVFRKNRIHSLAAKDRFEQKLFGFFLRHTGCIPIDRQHADTSWVHNSLKILKVDKENIAIYPEGRHGEHRHPLPFHTGVTMLACMAQVPIVMVYIDGPLRVPHQARLLVAPPFRLDPPQGAMTVDYIQQQTEILQSKMQSMIEEFERLEAQGNH